MIWQMIIPYPFPPGAKKGAVLALTVFLLLQALPFSFPPPLPLVGESFSREARYTAVNICGGEGGSDVSPAHDVLWATPPVSSPPQAWSAPGLPPDDGAPDPGPARRLYRPPRPAARF